MSSWPIIRTKLQPPVLRKEILSRPRLLTRIERALAGRLTLVEADAGFGKSTLLAAYLASAERPRVWFRLDAGDSDPATFAAYLLEGLRPHLSRRAFEAARGSLGSVSDWAAAVRLAAAVLGGLRRDLVIVLDDYHLLTAPALGEAMTRLIEDLPLRAHIAILTRTRPEFPTARWLVQGFATEFGPDDLRFTDPELRELVVDRYGLPVSEPALHLLAAKTEGWAAGVVLALHTIVERGPAEAAQEIAALSGSRREIYEYLAQEAIARQPLEVQRFLLATGALARFSAEFADALLETRGAREIVAFLERHHLFVVPLDTDRRWYRYHHLFQEFLRRLGTDRNPEWMRHVHARAARLWEARGEPQEALRHYIEAGEPAEAARVLGVVGLQLVARGQFETARRLLEDLPKEVWIHAPRLYLLQGVCEITQGEEHLAIATLEEACERLRESGDAEGEAAAMRWLALFLSDEEGMRRFQELIDRVRPRLPTFPAGVRTIMLDIVARAAEMRGAYAEAERAYRQSADAARTGDEVAETTSINPMWYLGRLLFSVGRFAESRAILEALVNRTRSRGDAHVEAHLHLELAQLWSLLGRPRESESHLAEAASLAATAPCRILHHDLLVCRGEANILGGRFEVAQALLREALEPAAPSHFHGIRIRAQMALALSLLRRAKHPDEARRLAIAAERDAAHMSPLWRVRALLTRGVVTGSVETCVEAATISGRLNLAHWRAVALAHAAELAESNARMELRSQTAAALGVLADEAWPFVLAQAGLRTLTPYCDDPVIGARVRAVAAPLRDAAERAESLEIRCLGALEIRHDGQVLPPSVWRRSSAKRLLQLLLVQDRPVHREEIMEAFWPDLDPRRAANRLRVALSDLRRVLERERTVGQPASLVYTIGSTVTLAHDRLDTDLARFRRAMARAVSSGGKERREQLAEAVGAYGGDLFADSPYEEWAAPHRDRLARQYFDALAALAEAEEEDGRWEAALARWTTLLECEPGAEHAHRGRMRACLALGRTADALRAFEECRRALADLGVTPSPETVQLHDRMTASNLVMPR